MSYLNLKNDRATVCTDKKCVTVYGDTAKVVNGIAVAATAFLAISLIARVLRKR